jgi:hypothetical protein
VREETHRTSIYRGKSLRLRLRDEDGDPLEMPTPQFLNNEIEETALVYPEAVHRAIHTNLFVPITRARDCVDNGIPINAASCSQAPMGRARAAAAAATLAERCGVALELCRLQKLKFSWKQIVGAPASSYPLLRDSAPRTRESIAIRRDCDR